MLREARERALLSQAELGARAGVSEYTISDLERGVRRTARLRTVYRISDALSIDPAELLVAQEQAS